MKRKIDFRPIGSPGLLRTPKRLLLPILTRTLGSVCALAFALAAFLWSQGVLGAQEPQRLRIGSTAPDFTAKAQDGREFKLSDYRGRPVFLMFLNDATSAPSLAALRSFTGQMAPYDRSGAKVFGVIPIEDATALKALHTREKLAFPLLLDPGRKLAATFGFRAGEAATAVVGPDGRLLYRVLAVEPERHAQTLVEVSRCCVDEMIQGRIQKVGQSVGEFSLPNAITGRMTPILGPKSKMPVAVFFLSARCPCSNAYTVRLKRAWVRYKTQGIRFVGIYANVDETAAEIAAHAKKSGFDFPVVRDERGLGVAHFKASVTPEVCVLDSSHKLRYRGRPDGARNEKEATTHELTAALDALLSGKNPPAPTSPFGCAIVQ